MAAPLGFQSLTTRLAILLCFWTALLLSIPSWLRLTTIERLPLPTRQVEALQLSEKCPVTFASSLTVLVDPELLPASTPSADQVEVEQASFLTQVEQLLQQSLEIKTDLPGAPSLECTQWVVETKSKDLKAQDDVVQPQTGRYVVQVLSESTRDSINQDSLPTVYFPLIKDATSSPLVPDTISAAVISELLHIRGDSPVSSSSSSTSAPTDAEQDPRVIQYSKHIRLVFSILNQDVTDTTAYDSYLIHALANSTNDDDDGDGNNPIGKLQTELKGLHEFHVETQVQWFAPLQFTPTQEALEEIVESEVEEMTMVDEVVEEDVAVEVEDDDTEEEEQADSTTATADKIQTDPDMEEAKVESQRDPNPPVKKQKRTIFVKQNRTIQVPRLQRVIQQTRTPLPPRHVIEWDDLQVFVNSEEWSLTSTVPPLSSSSSSAKDEAQRPFDVLSQTHDLHFLLYIPSRSHSPLYIRNRATGQPSTEELNAWLIPQWGGVVVLNAAHDSTLSSSLASVNSWYSAKTRGIQVKNLPNDQVEQAMQLFARQLRILLGLGDASSSSGKESDLETRIQISLLKKRRILELARESIATLVAITRLVDKIRNLGVGINVQNDTQSSLHILHSIISPSSGSGSGLGLGLDDVMEKVKVAYELANRGFFNSDMLGLLYFPQEHKYAVYTPLFAPLLIPLLVTSLKLVKQLVVGYNKS
ncbi:related to GPI transamidase component PIG-S [Ustilago trichophora]|uniref:Related to GPI transamidase component PIG-S n=1 Tax=Ustilago trichophora TaxID=86804 RepID=A0A5C3DX72_9BASI|nr:related to GPI transamidase component PIG-S [Ustilago trichophora]